MFTGFVIIDMWQIQGPFFSLQPVMVGVPVVMYILTACFVNATVKLASYIGNIPTRFSWNPGIIWPLVGNYEGS